MSLATHYGLGDLPRRFLDAASAAGLDVERLGPADLAAADEFHTGATELTARMDLAEGISYHLADAINLPFPAGSFDATYLLHVGMNVADKARLCTEVALVLTPGAFFAVHYPVPWAHDPAISFLHTPEHYRSCLEAAGFTVDPPRDRREFALEFWRVMRQRIAASGPSSLGLHLLMGADFSQKVANLIDAVQRAVIAPVEMIARLPR